MSRTQAVVWTDHQAAQVLRLDAEHVQEQKVRTHSHYTRQHHSGVRTEHEFFGEVCSALGGIDDVLVTGSRTAVADFRHYAEKHRPHVAERIAAYQIVDHPTENQLIALARQYFLELEAKARD
jgi:stalled ribosome rescue protein Dom34